MEDPIIHVEDFAGMQMWVYAVYLVRMLKEPMVKLGEVKELRSLQSVLGLDNMQDRRAHATAFYHDVMQFTSVDELDNKGHPDRLSLNKLLFLTERALCMGGNWQGIHI
jgi:hypothetical protein